MRPILLILLLFLGSNFLSRAGKAKMPAVFALKAGDTLRTVIMVSMDKSGNLNPYSFTHRKATALSARFKREKIPVTAIQWLQFTDLYNRKRTFVSSESGELEELLWAGRMQWRRRYKTSYMDGGTVSIDYLIDERGISFESEEKRENMRVLLQEAFQSHRPDLAARASQMDLTEENIIRLLQQYEEPGML